MVDTLKGSQSPHPDTLAAWLQRADDELLYDAETCEPQAAAMAVDAAVRLAMCAPQVPSPPAVRDDG